MVEFLLGKKERIMFSDEEATYGTAATRVKALGRNATFDPNKNNQNIQQIKGAGTNDLDVPVREFGKETWGGVLTYTPQDWQFLKFVLLSASSGVTDTDIGSGNYSHTFTNTETDLCSFSLERAQQATTSRVRTYEGCQVNSYALAWDSTGVGNFITATADIFAEDCANSTSVTSVTPPTTEGFKPRHVQLTLESGIVVYLQSGTFTINNSLTDGLYANYDLARLKGESAPVLRTYNLSAVAQITDDTFFDMYESAAVLSGTNTLHLERATNDDLTMTFTNAYLNTAPDPTNLEGINTVALSIDINSCAFVAKDKLTDYETFT